MKNQIELDGNTYFISGSEEAGYTVSKKHGEGEKAVGNPDRIKHVLELAQE